MPINEISAHYKIALPVVEAATATYQKALSLGLGEEDKGAMMKHDQQCPLPAKEGIDRGKVFEKKLGVVFRHVRVGKRRK